VRKEGVGGREERKKEGGRDGGKEWREQVWKEAVGGREEWRKEGGMEGGKEGREQMRKDGRNELINGSTNKLYPN